MTSFAKCLAAKDPQNLGFPSALKYDFDSYKLSHYFKKSLNKLLGSNFIAVYVKDHIDDGRHVKKNNVDIGCVTMFCVRPDMHVIRFTNSEWGDITDVTHEKD